MGTRLEINDRVELDVPGWRAPLSTRVEDLERGLVVVAAPVPGGDDHRPTVGSPLSLSWLTGRGPMLQTVVLDAKEDGHPPCWHLRSLGPAVLGQRRDHVRGRTLAPVSFQSGDGSVDARMVDLSEGGLHAVSAGPPVLAVGDRVTSTFEVEGEPMRLECEVVRTELHDGRHHLGCRFVEPPERDRDTIRRLVFALQLRERQP